MNYKEERPWGTFENLLEEKYCKVKQIVVKPGHRLSYQYHHRRSEHWVIVCGQAVVTLNGEQSYLTPGEHIHIPVTSKHRIHNIGKSDLVFVEVQCGDNFDEEDIVRIEDDYSR